MRPNTQFHYIKVWWLLNCQNIVRQRTFVVARHKQVYLKSVNTEAGGKWKNTKNTNCHILSQSIKKPNFSRGGYFTLFIPKKYSFELSSFHFLATSLFFVDFCSCFKFWSLLTLYCPCGFRWYCTVSSRANASIDGWNELWTRTYPLLS